ncbi:DUF2125 domain-containing protein [uncultured Shimia sp.]|uniref:DUF2125 domain-containing protein n=1 Tax=uncultured Shimia sp. TaxID=573152 RepID=UPI00260AAEEB|nr:DUF2125 domain-containing protein [uncultured Shimia sp.]
MTHWKNFTSLGALSVMLSAGTGFADVSSQDVWTAWKDMMTSSGYTVSGDEVASGGDLTVSDLIMQFELPPEDGDIRFEMGELAFEDQGDGTVRIILSETQELHMNVIEEGTDSDIVVLIKWDDVDMVASGDPDNVTYSYAAAGMEIGIDSLIVDGEPVEDFDVDVIASTLAGQSSIATGSDITSVQSMTVESIQLLANGQDEQDGSFDITMDVAGIALEGSGVMPSDADPNDPAAMMRAGFDMNGTFSSQSSKVAIVAQEEAGPTNVNLSTGASSLLVRFGAGLFEYDGGVQNLDLNMVGPELPLPVVLSMEEFSYGFLMPLLKGDTPQAFDANFKLGGLEVSDMLWGVFDPAGMLPRDPATIALSMTGAATLFQDLIEEDVEEFEEVPGELNALNINEILIDVVGANISGDGAFTFDNTDMETFDGFPRPTGALNLKGKGINGLLDTLVDMGLLPKEQVTGARMMMAMFTVPGESEDEMSSTIEINEAGHVLANGQRIQ